MKNDIIVNNTKKKELKDIIINNPDIIVRYRDKLKFDKIVTSKSGKLFFKMINSDFNNIYYIDDNNIIYVPFKGKLVPHDTFVKLLNKK